MSEEKIRVNITISKSDYEILVKLAETTGLKPTTLAKLLIKKVIEKNKDNTSDFLLFND